MKKMLKECPVCGEEFEYIDLRNIPDTCGKKTCVTNWEYQKRNYDPRTGYKPSFDKIKKW